MPQYVIQGGDYRAVISGSGGALRILRHGDRDLVTSWPQDGPVPFYSGTLLAPWPNRVAHARYTFRGETFRLPVNEPERGHALHGLVAFAGWRAAGPHEDGDASVRLTHTVEPSPGYPFRLRLEVRHALGPGGLTTTLTAENTGDRPAPYGCGTHPWLIAGDGPESGWELALPADRVLLTDEELLPAALRPVEETPFDFRLPRPIGETSADNAFTGLAAGPDGRTEVRLRGPRGGVRIAWDPAALPWAQVCTGTGFGHRGIAVEPMTCPADAFNSGTDLVVLDPGAAHEAGWTISAL
ncbi:galactose mutarotase [Sphaerisporangium krabiense]|uniref:Aldose 1-epimerase n=1 Tax=Sphaerisporangium krabiense TaxID=763782 RepID=A0A7W9DTS3_9ACTN|nr:aldose 1-epimerase family protein [Sphaerisporangium krabiense]MBB5629725.1 aldose 1-epimerase [Sphaerisporangium krabiense]GII63825.1 galactose mutarotase [Sphaerisporangium krabiense]